MQPRIYFRILYALICTICQVDDIYCLYDMNDITEYIFVRSGVMIDYILNIMHHKHFVALNLI